MSRKLYFIIAAALVAFYIFQTYAPSLNSEELAANKLASQHYLERNRSVAGVKVTASGLQYQRLQQGAGLAHPKTTDQVTVHYVGSLVSGEVFDSSIERGEPISFGLGRVIPGWQEGIPLMVEGDKMRFFIPPNLAYGEKWAGDIPPNSALIFDVELIKVN